MKKTNGPQSRKKKKMKSVYALDVWMRKHEKLCNILC